MCHYIESREHLEQSLLNVFFLRFLKNYPLCVWYIYVSFFLHMMKLLVMGLGCHCFGGEYYFLVT